MNSILFNTEMVRAILEGRKTATRRLVKPQPSGGVRKSVFCKSGVEDLHGYEIKPKYQIGEIIYVKETWGFDKNNWLYEADFSDTDLIKLKHLLIWHPSIHMKEKTARIFLKVVDIRVEKVQDITDEQAKAEGIVVVTNKSGMMHIVGFGILWNSIYPENDWAKNPWVWVYELELITEKIKKRRKKDDFNNYSVNNCNDCDGDCCKK